MRYLNVLVFCVIVVAAVSCSARPPELPQPTVSSLATPRPGFNSPLSTLAASPLATPAPALSAPDKGTLTGQIIDEKTGQPAGGRAVFLGSITPLKMGDVETHAITMLQQNSPNTMTDEQGHFTLTNIAPGTYALILWSPVHYAVVMDPKTKQDVLVTVQAGKTTDAGSLPATMPD